MPIAKAFPLTFSERLFAFIEGIARKWIMPGLSTLIPLPEIGDYIVAVGFVDHGRFV
jgi:hypothetical protein